MNMKSRKSFILLFKWLQSFLHIKAKHIYSVMYFFKAFQLMPFCLNTQNLPKFGKMDFRDKQGSLNYPKRFSLLFR